MKRARSWSNPPTKSKKQKQKRQRLSLANPGRGNWRPNRVEKKNFDFSNTATIVAGSSTAGIASMFTPDQGTAPTEHIGRRVQVRSLQWKWNGSFAATTAGSSPLRMVLLYDRQPNAAIAAVTTIFNSNDISTFTNLANSRRFINIADIEIPAVGSGGPQAWYSTGYRKLNLTTEFNETNGGTVADITTGNYIAVFWQNGNIITTSPTNSFTCRFRYFDS